MAIEYGHKDVVEALVLAGFSVNEYVSVQPHTVVLPLHVAIRKVDDVTVPLENEIIEYLLICGELVKGF